MKHTKIKYPVLSMILVGLLLLTLCIGAAWAVAYMVTGNVDNTFTPAVTSIEVREEFDGTTKRDVRVFNTGSTTDPKGPALYVRVKLLAYWYAGDSDHVAAKSAWTPSFTLGTDWVLKDGYYYYKKPVLAGESTSALISSIALTKDTTDNTRQVLEVVAEAIQSNPTTAATEAWNVSVDANGYITAS